MFKGMVLMKNLYLVGY